MRTRVLVIGGGIAGLTAARRLSMHGCAVTLIDRHAQLGGSLRTVDSAPCPPVLLLGWQQAIMSLLRDLHTETSVQQLRSDQSLLLSSHRVARLRWGSIAGPITAVWRLSTLSGLPLLDRWRLLQFLDRVRTGDEELPLDLESRSAESWVAMLGQSPRARAQVWEPICQLLVGEGLGSASAAQLVQLLRWSFFSSRTASRLAVLADDPERALLDPLCRALPQQGVAVFPETTATRISFEGNDVTGVELHDGATLTADHYILAVPHQQVLGLLPERILSRYSCFAQLVHLRNIPTVTVQLLFAGHVARPRLILTSGTFPWLLVRSLPGTPSVKRTETLISLVSTGNLGVVSDPEEGLLARALESLGEVLGETGEFQRPPIASWIVRRPHGNLSSKPGSAVLRPTQRTPIARLFLAGGWTHTGLPAGVDAAIRSGELCAQAILRNPLEYDHTLTSSARAPRISAL